MRAFPSVTGCGAIPLIPEICVPGKPCFSTFSSHFSETHLFPTRNRSRPSRGLDIRHRYVAAGRFRFFGTRIYRGFGFGFATRFPQLLLKNDLGWQVGLHPRSVECVSTCTAGRFKCSSPPRGPYHSRRTLWKTTQASKTTPAATDGINIKFSSVTESFLSSATTSRRTLQRPLQNCPRDAIDFARRTPGGPGPTCKAYCLAAQLWTLPRQLWCTSTNAIGWPFFEPVYRRLLGKSSMPPRREMCSGLHIARSVFHRVTDVTPQKASFHPSSARFCTLAFSVL